jgi:hypothetical protein
MASLGRAVLFGFLVWLIPFVIAFAISPLKESWWSLFESIMPVTLSIVVIVLAVACFRQVSSSFIRAGMLLGCLWFLMSVVIDLPLMLNPPMSMTFVEYAADIGLTYLMIPIITSGIAAAQAQTGKAKAG